MTKAEALERAHFLMDVSALTIDQIVDVVADAFLSGDREARIDELRRMAQMWCLACSIAAGSNCHDQLCPAGQMHRRIAELEKEAQGCGKRI